MQSYGDAMGTAGNVVKSGSTQPSPSGGDGRNPGQGTGAVEAVRGGDSPVVVKTGAVNNGTTNPGSYRGSNR